MAQRRLQRHHRGRPRCQAIAGFGERVGLGRKNQRDAARTSGMIAASCCSTASASDRSQTDSGGRFGTRGLRMAGLLTRSCGAGAVNESFAWLVGGRYAYRDRVTCPTAQITLFGLCGTRCCRPPGCLTPRLGATVEKTLFGRPRYRTAHGRRPDGLARSLTRNVVTQGWL